MVEDDPLSALPLTAFLTGESYHVVAVEDGQEAVEKFEQVQPQLVLMDINMPRMNGFEASRLIKQSLPPGKMVPVVFLTSEERDRELASCLECGGDDFVTKPFQPIVLKARIKAWLERARMANQITRDRELIERILQSMQESCRFEHSNLRLLTTPVERASGDCVMSCRRPDGGQNLLVGDFTGHGIAAALLGPMTEELFYNMSEAGRPLGEIITAINSKLYAKSPPLIFFAACGVGFSPDQRELQVWNAGMPEMLLYQDGQLTKRIHSTAPPIGIMSDLAVKLETLTVEQESRVAICSDGVIEACNADGKMFGQTRYEMLLEQLNRQGLDPSFIYQELSAFAQGQSFHDDVTWVEICCTPG
uniref:Putative response regulator receiver protein with a stage II sporulation protein E (SpoIIE) domain n=1 Tax=Magnetococcus massalia (strain MO-1) TaxID=451514 RepID=A0A1S7LJ63_MAGMO|nr:Putative response regulator receiver protein with a stage II sporulation protein E (SpoIIE) domain [Candidatus Magnetococcus massalia]